MNIFLLFLHFLTLIKISKQAGCRSGQYDCGFLGTGCCSCAAQCNDCNGRANSCVRCNSGYAQTAPSCPACQSPCATCSYSPTVCTSCQSGLILKNSACACANQCNGCNGRADSCVRCNSGYAQVPPSCPACQSPCATCSYSPNVCTSCQSGFSLQDSTSGKCVPTEIANGCNGNAYYDYTLRSCSNCYLTGCKKCLGPVTCGECGDIYIARIDKTRITQVNADIGFRSTVLLGGLGFTYGETTNMYSV